MTSHVEEQTNTDDLENWDTFFSHYKRTPRGEEFAKLLAPEVLRQALSPALTICSAIKRWDLMPRAPRKLSILWIGAELPELLDGGRWLALIPEFLNCSVEVSVTFVEAKAKALPAPNPRVLEVLPTSSISIRSFDGLEEENKNAIDLIVWSHPENVTRWRETLPPLPDAPLLTLVWSSIDYAMEREWLELSGWPCTGTARNGFDLDNNVDAGASWARFAGLHRKGEGLPEISEEELKTLGMIRHHSGLRGYGHPSSQAGQPRKGFKVRGAVEGDEYVYVTDDLYLNLANRMLYHYSDQDRNLTPITEIAEHLLKDRPSAGQDVLVAYKWAAKIKLNYDFLTVEKRQRDRNPNAVFEDWLRTQSERSDRDAMFSLGRWIENGLHGKELTDELIEIYRTAASLGHASAQYAYGDILWHDIGDKQKAITQFMAAGAQNHGLAIYNLAIMNLDGLVEGASLPAGLEWAERGAALNQINCLGLLGDFHFQRGVQGISGAKPSSGLPNPQNEFEKALHYAGQAADRGLVTAAETCVAVIPPLLEEAPKKRKRALTKQFKRYKAMLQKSTGHAAGGSSQSVH